MINRVYQLIRPKLIATKLESLNWDNKVLIRPRYMSICHADRRYYLGLRSSDVLKKKLPMALIHECSGIIEASPNGEFQTGEQVVLIPTIPAEHPDYIYENYAEKSIFCSSGCDGFMREFVTLPADRVVSARGIPLSLASITEFVSVAVHAVNRFMRIAHNQRRRIGIWGDGSLGYTVANVLKELQPSAVIAVIGRQKDKLSRFSFADETFTADTIPVNFRIDHAFECAGGEGCTQAIDDIIRCIAPQGTVVLMGVSENKVPVYTRNMLEKGLTFLGCSRSEQPNFIKALELMKHIHIQNYLTSILYEDKPVQSIADIHRVFATDSMTPFKTVFEWKL